MLFQTAFEDYIDLRKLEPAAASDFYRDIFPLGCLEKAGFQQTGKYNAIVRRPGMESIYLHDDLAVLSQISADDKAYISNVSYAGKTATKELARELYAIVIPFILPETAESKDIILSFKKRIFRKYIKTDTGEFLKDMTTPDVTPTYIMAAGKQLYLFYLFEYPVPLYKKFVKKLNSIKTGIAKVIYDNLSASIYAPVVHQKTEDIFSRFPVVGTYVGGSLCRVYKVGRKWSVYDLNQFVTKNNMLHYKPAGIAPKPVWVCSSKIYYAFLERVASNQDTALPGCLEALASYARKCRIPTEQYIRDSEAIFALLEVFNSTLELQQHAQKAEYLYNEQKNIIVTWTNDYIEKLTGLQIPRNKRNGRTRSEHLKMVHKATSKQKVVSTWRKENPDGNKADCARALGISRNTAAKWWDSSVSKPVKNKTVCDCGSDRLIIEKCKWFSPQNGNYYTTTRTICLECGCIVHETKARIDN